MAEPVLLDTGPLVALLSSEDEHHAKCEAELRQLRRRPITCWPVLTEAAWLLKGQLESVEKLFSNLDGGLFEVVELSLDSGQWLAAFLRRYHDAGAQIADAARMYLAETRKLDTIFTLDRRDFSIYRTTDGRALRMIPSV